MTTPDAAPIPIAADEELGRGGRIAVAPKIGIIALPDGASTT